MASPYLFMVRANVDPAHEAAFNAWYNNEHLHDVAKLPGCIQAARYRILDDLEGDSSYRYLALYEFESEEALRAAAGSAYFQELIRRFDADFGSCTTRIRAFFGQIYPPPHAGDRGET